MEPAFSGPPRSFAGLAPPYSERDRAGVVLLPVPYDGTAEWHTGAREAPGAIITASTYLEMYDIELDREICQVGIHTLPELVPDMSGPEAMVERVYRVAGQVLAGDKIMVMLGGEHTLTLGMVKAYREKYTNLSVLQLDAHADLRDSYLGASLSQATVMRRVAKLCPVVPVGIRSLSLEEKQFIDAAGIRPFHADELISGRVDYGQVVESLSPDVYVTIDVDVLDPSVMPAVGTPEPGGLGWYELLRLLRRVARERHIVGFDLVELCPPEGPDACAFLAAKLVYKLIGYIFEG
jgi:agmatinase